jgi:glycosyltransferase involved in cell wall biosynthesis
MFFSVIIPTYNRATLLERAIVSVLNQTYSNWELIIVDDGSTDNTFELVSSYDDLRIKYIYQENSERSAARNKGIVNASGEYICFLDSDDYYLPTRLENLHNFIKQMPRSFFYTGIQFDNGISLTPFDEKGHLEKEINLDFIAEQTIGTPQVCIHRVFLEEEKFNPALSIGEDKELWFRLAEIAPIVFITNEQSVVALNHEDRSVNLKKYNSGFEQLKTFQLIFSESHLGKKVSKSIRNTMFSNCYFLIFKYWFYQRNRIMSIYFLLKSICSKPFHKQTKFKINLTLLLVFQQSFSKIEGIVE